MFISDIKDRRANPSAAGTSPSPSLPRLRRRTWPGKARATDDGGGAPLQWQPVLRAVDLGGGGGSRWRGGGGSRWRGGVWKRREGAWRRCEGHAWEAAARGGGRGRAWQ
jgi:hypothetical protein